MKRIIKDPNANDARVREYSINVDDQELFRVDFTKVNTEQSSTVSSVAWSSVGSQALTFASESLSSGVADAYVSASSCGHAALKCQATLDNGRVSTVFASIDVEDPEWSC